MRLNLTNQDKKALEAFFTNRTYKKDSDYMKLAHIWKSTTEISRELDESGKRTLQRVDKLAGFGLLYYSSIPYYDRIDHYWSLNREGLYYFMSTLDDAKLVAFLRSNKKEHRNFSLMETLALKRDVQIRYLTSQIKNIVNNYQYFLIEGFIKKWLIDNFGVHADHHFYPPSIKEVIKRVYGRDKEMVEKLSHIYGKIY